jgi:hypothetical protein
MITGFIFVMMVIIDVVNIQTRGVWQKSLVKSRWSQYLVAGIFGAIPGCLGSFTAVGLYSHGLITYGAVLTCMIATSGDAAFLMFSLIPGTALLLTAILLVIGLAAGKITDGLIGLKSGGKTLPFHPEDCICFKKEYILPQLRYLTLQRGTLILLTGLVLAGILSGRIGPGEWNWIRVTFLVVSLAALFIILTVSEHFLEDHLWGHVVKKHVPQMFLWIFGTLLALHFLTEYLRVEEWIRANPLLILVIAVLIGLIPDSGPHLIFVTLFAQGSIPFGILLANSIVQDGHGMLPMLAESRKTFVSIKLINLVLGFLCGGVLLLL